MLLFDIFGKYSWNKSPGSTDALDIRLGIRIGHSQKYSRKYTSQHCCFKDLPLFIIDSFGGHNLEKWKRLLWSI
jgi:hypothetical protein